MMDASRVRVSGPLACWAPELVRWLTDCGFGAKASVEHVRRLAVLSRWLDQQRREPGSVDEELVATMVAELHAEGKNTTLTPRSFRRLLGFLRAHGAVPPATQTVTPVDALVACFGGYLAVERGLAAGTIKDYSSSARWFLSVTCADEPDRLATLSPGDVAGFVVTVSEVRGARSVNGVVIGVRSLLSWCYLCGRIDTPLAQATPWLARARMSSLPRTVPEGTGERLLASCDPATVVGSRDLALMTVLVRLGLRVGEVVAMELDDVDWRRGEVMVRSKGGWRDPLPLPVDVGQALVAYLARRGPDNGARQVFLQVRAPRQPMTMTGMRAVVRRACSRVGIADTSTHRLRHAAATDMLRHGSPLHEIGMVLRHRDVATTSMYAKVDFAALATVAQPWPIAAGAS